MTAAPSYGEHWPKYVALWDGMVIQRLPTALSTARRLVETAAKQRYLAVTAATHVPWWMVAVMHERESSQDWQASLAQGDRWDRVSMHVPKGRGPFASWQDAAVDALRLEGFDGIKDWCLEKALYHLEAYNGWGYFRHGVSSAYVWAGTNQYSRGKYTADGTWSPGAIDKQLGCAAMLKCMASVDPTITFVRET